MSEVGSEVVVWGGKRWEKGEGRKGEGEIGRGRGGGGGPKGGGEGKAEKI